MTQAKDNPNLDTQGVRIAIAKNLPISNLTLAFQNFCILDTGNLNCKKFPLKSTTVGSICTANRSSKIQNTTFLLYFRSSFVVNIGSLYDLLPLKYCKDLLAIPNCPSCINQYGVSGSLLKSRIKASAGTIIRNAVILQDRNEPKIQTNKAPIVINVDGKITKLALMLGWAYQNVS